MIYMHVPPHVCTTEIYLIITFNENEISDDAFISYQYICIHMYIIPFLSLCFLVHIVKSLFACARDK